MAEQGDAGSATDGTLTGERQAQHLSLQSTERLLQQTLDRIANNTYPFMVRAAKELYTRIDGEMKSIDEPVDLGTTALDV